MQLQASGKPTDEMLERGAKSLSELFTRMAEWVLKNPREVLSQHECGWWMFGIEHPNKIGFSFCMLPVEGYPKLVKTILELCPTIPGMAELLTEEVVLPWVQKLALANLEGRSPEWIEEARAAAEKQMKQVLDTTLTPTSKPQ